MKQKRVIVIGGTSGYGEGIVNHLISKGYDVYGFGRTSCPSIDVRDEDTIKLVLKTLGTFDVMVYAAGLAIGKDYVSDKSIDEMEEVFDVNTLGLLKVLKHSYKPLLDSQGSFIAIGSIAHELSYVGGADYCASKSASNTVMKTIRKEWLGTGIRTTSIEAGLGNTNFQIRRYKNDIEKVNQHISGLKLIEPSDMGELVEYIINLPKHLNLDEVVFKPIQQASHGITTEDIKMKKQF
jgi:3-hydroxy acid dehydrogenase/malonic semialdehyde reductase